MAVGTKYLFPNDTFLNEYATVFTNNRDSTVPVGTPEECEKSVQS